LFVVVETAAEEAKVSLIEPCSIEPQMSTKFDLKRFLNFSLKNIKTIIPKLIGNSFKALILLYFISNVKLYYFL
jgi:hypothetical protein